METKIQTNKNWKIKWVARERNEDCLAIIYENKTVLKTAVKQKANTWD